MIRQSQAFAAFRKSIINELNNDITTSLVPDFNSECEDIRRQYTDTETFASDQPDVAKVKLIELAESRKRARILDLVVRKNKFLESLKVRLVLEMKQRLDEYHAEVMEEDEERDGKTRKVLKAKFPDGSQAKVPQNIHIDFSVFDRV